MTTFWNKFVERGQIAFHGSSTDAEKYPSGERKPILETSHLSIHAVGIVHRGSASSRAMGYYQSLPGSNLWTVLVVVNLFSQGIELFTSSQ